VWSASHSQIYPELARLADAGLVTRSDAGARGRTTYAATEAGIATVRAWLQSEVPPRNYRSEWMLRIFFLWMLTADEARAYLTREREAHLVSLAEFEHIAANFPPHTPAEQAGRIALEAGLRLERAMIDWTDYALAEIDAR
jgi:PadR family transcriptional regulator AphA